MAERKHRAVRMGIDVGGTTRNIGVIKNGRPGVDYAQIGGHDTYISSLDVRILGCAGGSMVRVNDKAVVDVGPRSAHIAGCEYACFTPEEELLELQIEMVSPKLGDPADYVTLRLKNGKRICFTNTCAANVLGLIDEKYFAHGNANAARKAMQPVADKLGITVEELATQILDKDFEKVNACITALADKYQLDHDSMKLVLHPASNHSNSTAYFAICRVVVSQRREPLRFPPPPCRLTKYSALLL